AMHWFNPVAWLAFRGLRSERELACDAAVLRHLDGHERCCYGQALLKIASQPVFPAMLSGVVGAFVKDRSLVRRIHMIADYRKPKAAENALGVLLLVVLGAFGLTNAVAKSENRANSEQLPAAAKAYPRTSTV